MRKAIRCAALSVACLTLATALGARAGELTAHMTPANLIHGSIKFQTVNMGHRTFKFVEFTPQSNPALSCMGTVHYQQTALSKLHNLTGVVCFNKGDAAVNRRLNSITRPAESRKSEPQNEGWSSW